nr:uncharacterized protein LOC115265292 isoform X2 [Aedes albopictus]XP_029725642.1 uncharacterized protein LOC115265292 isoform X3 [Aedes albopictus]
MDFSARVCLVIFAILLVGNQLLKAQPIPNYDEQDDMLDSGTNPSADVEETTMLINFDRWTPAPGNSPNVLPDQNNDGMIDKMINKIRGWKKSAVNKVRSWGQSMKREFCSYECFQQYARFRNFCNKQNELQQ